MNISISLQREFVPEWNNNKESEDPIVVVYKAPTMNLRQQLIPNPKIVLKISPDGKAEGGETTIEVDNRKIIYGMLEEIKNLTLTVDGKEKEIRTANDLYSGPAFLGGLVDEIGAFFQKELSKSVDVKN